MLTGISRAAAALNLYAEKIEAAVYCMNADPAVNSGAGTSGAKDSTDEVPVRPGSTPSGFFPSFSRLGVESEPDTAAPIGLFEGLTDTMINQRYYEAQLKTIRMFGELAGTMIDLVG